MFKKPNISVKNGRRYIWNDNLAEVVIADGDSEEFLSYKEYDSMNCRHSPGETWAVCHTTGISKKNRKKKESQN